MMSQPPYSGPPGDPYSGQPGQPPYPGQPYPGQPNPDVPTSVPPQPGYPPTTSYPAYGQPAAPQYGQAPPPYGQPDYAQQGYGQPGYPPPGQPPKKKSRALPIILVSIGIVLVLCIGGITAAFLVGKDKVDDVKKAIDTAASATPTVPSDPGTPEATTPTTEPPAPVTNVKIKEPKTLGGRPKINDPSLATTTKTMTSALLDEYPDATASFGAFYGVPAKKTLVMALGVEAPIPDPALEVTKNFAGMGVSGNQIKNIVPVSTGALGGTAKCGSSQTSGVNLAVCSWADEGSSGMLVFYYKSVAKAKAEFPALRAQIEKKS
jgi:hypothetical protein